MRIDYTFISNMCSKVSVVVPTYNREEFIAATIESVLQQSYNNIELIVIDDGSTDNTEQIIQRYSDKSITYLENKRRSGANGARNTGIKEATGDYILFLDSDDLLTKYAVETMVNRLENAEASYLGAFPSYKVIRNDKIWKTNIISEKDIHRSAIEESGNTIGGFSGNLVVVELFDKIGLLDERLEKAQDIDFYMRALPEGDFLAISEVLYYFRRHNDKISADVESIITGNKQILEKYRDDFTPLHKGKRYVDIGDAYVQKREIKQAKKYFEKAIIIQLSNDDKSKMHYRIGTSFGNHGFMCDARAHFRNSIQYRGYTIQLIARYILCILGSWCWAQTRHSRNKIIEIVRQ